MGAWCDGWFQSDVHGMVVTTPAEKRRRFSAAHARQEPGGFCSAVPSTEKRLPRWQSHNFGQEYVEGSERFPGNGWHHTFMRATTPLAKPAAAHVDQALWFFVRRSGGEGDHPGWDSGCHGVNMRSSGPLPLFNGSGRNLWPKTWTWTGEAQSQSQSIAVGLRHTHKLPTFTSSSSAEGGTQAGAGASPPIQACH
jgi:hypothetical protein